MFWGAFAHSVVRKTSGAHILFVWRGGKPSIFEMNPGFEIRLLTILEQTLSNLHSRHARNLTQSICTVLDRNPRRSYIIQHRLFEFSLNLLALFVRCRLAMKVKQSTEIEFRRLQKLYLPNMDLRYFNMP